MQIGSHILAGWCLANALPLSPVQRSMAMLASVLPDLDGVGLLISEDLYWQFHHKVGHNVLAGIAISVAVTMLSRGRLKFVVFCLVLFHLHLLMDLLGSGPGWSISYLWPFSPTEFRTRYAWAFDGWQNIAAGVSLLVLTSVIALRFRRTPLEWVMPSMDAKVLGLFGAASAGPR